MSNKKPIALSAKEAQTMLDSDTLSYLIDIRSSMEFLFVGHPIGAIHIPWMDEPDWDINPHFVADVRKLLLGVLCAVQKTTALKSSSSVAVVTAQKLQVSSCWVRIYSRYIT